MARVTKKVSNRPPMRSNDHGGELSLRRPGRHRSFMRTPGERVKKYVRAERHRRGMSQADLAKAAGIKSRTTIQNLENGASLRDGLEAAIEDVFDWPIGTLDAIRVGEAPPEHESTTAPAPYAQAVKELASLDDRAELLERAMYWRRLLSEDEFEGAVTDAAQIRRSRDAEIRAARDARTRNTESDRAV